jgi:hypothetical protein
MGNAQLVRSVAPYVHVGDLLLFAGVSKLIQFESMPFRSNWLIGMCEMVKYHQTCGECTMRAIAQCAQLKKTHGRVLSDVTSYYNQLDGTHRSSYKDNKNVSIDDVVVAVLRQRIGVPMTTGSHVKEIYDGMVKKLTANDITGVGAYYTESHNAHPCGDQFTVWAMAYTHLPKAQPIQPHIEPSVMRAIACTEAKKGTGHAVRFFVEHEEFTCQLTTHAQQMKDYRHTVYTHMASIESINTTIRELEEKRRYLASRADRREINKVIQEHTSKRNEFAEKLQIYASLVPCKICQDPNSA